MATFRTAPVHWPGAADVHIAWNSVYERSAKFVRCGVKIGPEAIYDRTEEGEDLVATCPKCLDGVARDALREGKPDGQ